MKQEVHQFSDAIDKKSCRGCSIKVRASARLPNKSREITRSRMRVVSSSSSLFYVLIIVLYSLSAAKVGKARGKKEFLEVEEMLVFPFVGIGKERER